MNMDGVVEEPLSSQQELLARLDDPNTSAALHHLLDRLDVIVLAADSADALLRRSEVVADSLADSFAELRQVSVPSGMQELAGRLPQLAHTGVQVADLAANPAFGRLLSSGLLERLGDPKTIESLHGLLDHLDLASFALTVADGFLKRSEGIADSIAESLAEVTQSASRIDMARIKEVTEAIPSLLEMAVQVKRSGLIEHARVFIDTLDQLRSSGILGSETVALVSEVSAAATATQKKHEYAASAPTGIFGLLGALRDPDVQATLGFGIAFARNYGRTLRANAK